MTNARSLWRVAHPDMPFPGPVGTLEQVREWIRLRQGQLNHPRDAALYSIDSVPTCGCCGTDVGVTGIYQGRLEPEALHHRCEKHVDRNPCLIEGCGRTFANDGDYRGQFICGKHWRLAPKRMRDVVARVRKIGEKTNWPRPTVKRFCRLWERTARAAQAAAAGDLDMAEINRIMGWD